MAPVITQVVPVADQGEGGIKVVITGKNFEDASDVKFGNVDAGSIVVNRAGTKIHVFAPPGMAGTVNLTVTAIGGTSAPVPTDQFTYLPPVILTVSSPTGSVSGGTRVHISGTGLAGATSVTFGGVPSSEFTVRNSGTMVTAVAPAESPRTVVIAITTPGGTVVTSGSKDFTYTVVPPPSKSHHK
jgi:hypothetical protein